MRYSDVNLDNCLKCSDCNTVCPVLTAYAPFPGPKHLGPELERLRREGLPCDSEWLEYCLNCDRCNVACPNQVDVSGLIAAAKTRHVKSTNHRLRDYWLSRPALLGDMLSVVPAASNVMLGLSPVRQMMSATMQIAKERPFPPYRRPYHARSSSSASGEKILYFPGCSVRYNEPELGAATLAVLQHNGFQVNIPDVGCCGIPALANGDAAESERAAWDVVEELFEAVQQGQRVVTTCTSCGHMLKVGLAEVLANDAAAMKKAAIIAKNTYDLGELLMERADQEKLESTFHPTELNLAYHTPCHQLSQGIGRPWFHLLQRIPGVQIKDLNAGCCGMAGTFGFKEEKYPISMAVGQRLFDSIREANPQMVITECPTCRLQIEHAAKIKVIHPVQVLQMAYEGKA